MYDSNARLLGAVLTGVNSATRLGGAIFEYTLFSAEAIYFEQADQSR